MNVAVLGSGGREHALAWMLKQDPSVNEIFVLPGNGGTDHDFKNVAVPITPPYTELIAFVREQDISLVVVGPEQYLAEGVVDALEQAGLMVCGPTASAARLESSKAFAKSIMAEAGVPTADYATFDEMGAAQKHLETCTFPTVLKADGLCAGKGVIIAKTHTEAVAALRVFWDERRFGDAAKTVLIEDFLEGPEISVQVLTDGENIITLPPAQDHKRLLDHDAGPNTGGMGVYSPVAFLPPSDLLTIEETIIHPVLKTLREKGIRLRGVLYAGLIKDPRRGFRVLEFNVRFGDPETQCILPLMRGGFARILTAIASRRLAELPASAFQPNAQASVTVVLASAGYPLQYETGMEITGLADVRESLVFHAGTHYDATKKVFRTAGGRVLTLTATGASLTEARERVYADVSRVNFTGKIFRTDIGLKGL